VGAVHVGVRHDDDLVIARLRGVEAADGLVALADTGAARGDEGADFLVAEDLVEAGLLRVDQLAAEREDGLETAVAALLGGATGGVALDDVELGERRVAPRSSPASLPGRPPPERAPLRTVSRALRAASRARAALRDLSTMRLPTGDSSRSTCIRPS